jgi:hypothetical protein
MVRSGQIRLYGRSADAYDDANNQGRTITMKRSLPTVMAAGMVVVAAFAVEPAAAVEPASIGASAVRIGETSLVVRSVHGVLPAERRTLRPADPVHASEVVETGAESASRITFLDKTELATGPNSKVTLDQFVFAGDQSGQKLAIGFGKGVMRFVTGAMDSRAYEVKTQGTVIGFRGTSVLFVSPEGREAIRELFGDLDQAAIEQIVRQAASEVVCIQGEMIVTEAGNPANTATCPPGTAVVISGGPIRCVPPSAFAQALMTLQSAYETAYGDGAPPGTPQQEMVGDEAIVGALQQSANGARGTTSTGGGSCPVGC